MEDSLLLRIALTHSSAADITRNNERLEFLGDALLSAWVADYLYHHLPPETREDTLSRARVQVVRKETLADAGRRIGIPELLAVGQGERKEQRNQRDSLVADAYEAVVAALYQEAGPEAMSRFLQATLAPALARVLEQPALDDPKTRLQILLQATGRGLPSYETLSEVRDGEHHHFVVVARTADGIVLGQGEGSSKRAAQRTAAMNALSHEYLSKRESL
jgi:ribonuclease-3